MTEVERIKKIIKEDKSFRNNFLGFKNVKTAVAIARSKGFNITEEDVLSDTELSDSILEASANGGWNFWKTLATVFCPPAGAALLADELTSKPSNSGGNTYNNYNYNYNYHNTTNNTNNNVDIHGDGNEVQQVNQQGKKT